MPDSTINIEGHDLFRQDRTPASGKSVGRGVCIYASNQYNVIPREEFNLCCPDIEMCWVQLQLKDTRSNNIGYIYRPPDGNLDRALEFLGETTTAFRSQSLCELVLLGDFNIGTLKPRLPNTKNTKKSSSNCCYQILLICQNTIN